MSLLTIIFSLILGFFLGFVHFIGEGLKLPEGSRHYHIISFASGISISYLFLDLLPHTYDAAGVLLAFTVPLPLMLQSVTISGISGVLLYVFVKEFLPEKEKGQPIFFILGLIVFFVLNNVARLLID